MTNTFAAYLIGVLIMIDSILLIWFIIDVLYWITGGMKIRFSDHINEVLVIIIATVNGTAFIVVGAILIGDLITKS